jgi:hypothetical protein
MGINLASNKLEKHPWRSPKYHIIAPLRASQIDDDKPLRRRAFAEKLVLCEGGRAGVHGHFGVADEHLV